MLREAMRSNNMSKAYERERIEKTIADDVSADADVGIGCIKEYNY